MDDTAVRRATPADAAVVATLLHDFNLEFDTPSPGVPAISARLADLLSSDATLALLAGEPAFAVALVTFRPNVWFTGPVALLDELYVVPALRGRGIGGALIAELFAECDRRGVQLIEINVDAPDVDAQRFYERHGFSGVEPTTGERAYYYSRET